MQHDNVRIRLIVAGRVQGVWFRDSTRAKARELGVYGWVKNSPDGSVEILAEGPADRVNELITWSRKGPPHARVTQVREFPEKNQGEFDSFNIVW